MIELGPAYGWLQRGAASCERSAAPSQLGFKRQAQRAPERPALRGPAVRAPSAHFIHVGIARTELRPAYGWQRRGVSSNSNAKRSGRPSAQRSGARP